LPNWRVPELGHNLILQAFKFFFKAVQAGLGFGFGLQRFLQISIQQPLIWDAGVRCLDSQDIQVVFVDIYGDLHRLSLSHFVTYLPSRFLVNFKIGQFWFFHDRAFQTSAMSSNSTKNIYHIYCLPNRSLIRTALERKNIAPGGKKNCTSKEKDCTAREGILHLEGKISP
jgi:hypothetical protein